MTEFTRRHLLSAAALASLSGRVPPGLRPPDPQPRPPVPPIPSAPTPTPTPPARPVGVLDPRDFGMVADGSTDDTAALDAVLAAAAHTGYNSRTGNDVPASAVMLPWGHIRVEKASPFMVPPNCLVFSPHGPASTYLVTQTMETAVLAATGVQSQFRGFGIIQNSPAMGIDMASYAGGTSITGDTMMLLDDVIVVGGRAALTEAGSENRISNFRAYRQSGIVQAAVGFWGTDSMVSNLTVAQPSGTGEGTWGVLAHTSNSRFVNCKVFGGDEPLNTPFRVIGQRNQFHGLEIQDTPGAAAIVDDQGNNIYVGGLIDSCAGYGLYTYGKVIVRGMGFVNRFGGRYRMDASRTVGGPGVPDSSIDKWELL